MALGTDALRCGKTTGKTGFPCFGRVVASCAGESPVQGLLYCYHYKLAGGGGGVSRARSAARASRKSPSIPVVSGCAPPNTRRVVRSESSSVVTLSRRSSSVAPSAL